MLSQGTLHDVVQFWRVHTQEFVQGRRRLVDNFQKSRTCILALEWQRVSEQLVKNNSRGKNIRPQVYRLAVDLLWGHVVNAAHDLAWARQVVCPDVSQAEVNDLDHATAGNHEITGLNVAMNGLSLMRVV